MAQKKKAGKSKSTKTSSSASNVTRVRATDTSSVKKEKTPKIKAEKVAKEVKTAEVVEKTPKAKTAAPVEAPKKAPRKKRTVKPGAVLVPFVALGRYFKGAWVELKQVHWPTRKATWSMTGAVLLYTAFFVILVLLLDAGFKYLFELILAK